MKRKICLIICFLTICITILGCSSSPFSKKEDRWGKNTESVANNEKQVTIKYMDYILTKEVEEVSRKQISEFNKTHSDINVVVEMLPWESYLDKLVIAVSAGMPPDVAKFKAIWLPTFEKIGNLAVLDEYYDNWKYKYDLFDMIIPYYRKQAKDERLYIFPNHIVSSYLIYRKDLLKEAGVQPPNTMVEFLDAAKKLTKDKNGDGIIDQYGYAMRTNSNGQGAWFCFAFSNMIKPSFYKDMKISLSSPEVIEANQFWIDMFKVHHVVPPTALTDGTKENIENLVSGRAAMMVQHVQTSKKILKLLGDNMGVKQIPEGNRGGRFSTLEETGTVIYDKCKNKDEAFEFISWLIEPEQHKTFVENGDTVVFLKSLVEKYIDNPVQQVSIDSLKYGEFMPTTAFMGEWTTKIWPNETAKALDGMTNSSQMLKTLEREMYNKD